MTRFDFEEERELRGYFLTICAGARSGSRGILLVYIKSYEAKSDSESDDSEHAHTLNSTPS